MDTSRKRRYAHATESLSGSPEIHISQQQTREQPVMISALNKKISALEEEISAEEEEISSLEEEISVVKISIEKNEALLRQARAEGNESDKQLNGGLLKEDKGLLKSYNKRITSYNKRVTELQKEKLLLLQQAMALSGEEGQAGLANECVFYCAEMKMVGSKDVKGVRAEVYSVASKHGGFYNNSKEESIYYCGKDLVVKILFESSKECSQFVNELDSSLRYFPRLGEVYIKRPFEIVAAPSSLVNLLQRDYNSKDGSLEECSIAITHYTHITSKTSIDFETELMMIEDPNHEDFYRLNCYKCHLMSQADYPEERDNPNNSLWMSWPTYHRFNGLYTFDEHRVPQFAISFVCRSNEIQAFGLIERERIDIAVECANEQILGVLRKKIKSGMTVDEENKKIYTYVFVENAKDFERCLTHKYRETKFMWTKKNHGELVTEDEAHSLRKSARLQVNKDASLMNSGVYKISLSA